MKVKKDMRWKLNRRLFLRGAGVIGGRGVTAM